MIIPLLWNHDPGRVIGSLDLTTRVMTFEPRTVTTQTIFDCGFRVIEEEWHDGQRWIVRAELIELSVGGLTG